MDSSLPSDLATLDSGADVAEDDHDENGRAAPINLPLGPKHSTC